MKVNPPFVLRETYSEAVLQLLKNVTLGSKGARYKNRHIEARISRLYQPLFLNMERNNAVIGNITLCRRDVGWYVRYFAIDNSLQSSTSIQKKTTLKNNKLKQNVSDFFDEVFESENPPPMLYAYIDPRNERSLWMAKNFGFYPAAKIATQTFSRIRPKPKKDVTEASDLALIHSKINQENSHKPLYFNHHTFSNENPIFELVKNEEVVAFANTYQAEWVIERMPGKRGSLLKNIIPYVPGVRKVVRPKAHKFTVVDSVWVKDNDSSFLEELFEGILEKTKRNTLIWWVDQKEGVYQKTKNSVNWGLLHKINGAHEVELVVKREKNNKKAFKAPTYITGFDFI